MKPGSRGGKYWIDKYGNVRYDENSKKQNETRINLENTLTQQEKDAIIKYTTFSGKSKLVNQLLRKELKVDKQKLSKEDKVVIDEINEIIVNFTTALKKMPSYQGTVYRITSVNRNVADRILSKINKNGKLSWNQFLSSSTKKGVTNYFLGRDDVDFRLKIKSKTGKDISILSFHKGEKEIIFLPNTKFEIINKSTEKVEDYDKKIIVLELKEI